MKQIPFNADLIGKPGIVVKYRDGSKPELLRNYADCIKSVTNDFEVFTHEKDGAYVSHSHHYSKQHSLDLLMYREARTAEEVAREFWGQSVIVLTKLGTWDEQSVMHTNIFTALAQAGMDEIKP